MYIYRSACKVSVIIVRFSLKFNFLGIFLYKSHPVVYCNNREIYSTTYIGNQYQNLVTCFSSKELTLGQIQTQYQNIQTVHILCYPIPFTKHSTGTFRQCTHCAIPYRLTTYFVLLTAWSTILFLSYFRKIKKYQNFMKIFPVVAELFHAHKKTDRRDDAISRVSHFHQSALRKWR